jgi:hypothetical protein
MREIGGLLASSASSSATTTVPTGLILLAVGLILCFFGVRSLRLSGFLVGFALAALLADVLGADPLISLIIWVAGGNCRHCFVDPGLWLIGLVGGVIGVRAYQYFLLGKATRLSWCCSCLRWV